METGLRERARETEGDLALERNGAATTPVSSVSHSRKPLGWLGEVKFRLGHQEFITPLRDTAWMS